MVTAEFRVAWPHIAKYFRCPASDHHYRYADILLIAAEAIAEFEGVTLEAISYINQIRQRARYNGVVITDYPEDMNSGINTPDFINFVREERSLEFAVKFKRWYDIKR